MLLTPIIVGGAAFFSIDYALGWGWLGWFVGMAAWLLITIPWFKHEIERMDRR